MPSHELPRDELRSRGGSWPSSMDDLQLSLAEVEGTGERVLQEAQELRIIRGGTYQNLASEARVSRRDFTEPTHAAGAIGVRPARRLPK